MALDKQEIIKQIVFWVIIVCITYFIWDVVSGVL